eukprot:31209-Pelagococcus_subviridis.AAC.14
MESYNEPLLIVSHQAILRCIFAYLTGVDREKAPGMETQIQVRAAKRRVPDRPGRVLGATRHRGREAAARVCHRARLQGRGGADDAGAAGRGVEGGGR